MYELVDRYLRRLDAELFKFKIELEADNAGITEVLEKSVYLSAGFPSKLFSSKHFLKKNIVFQQDLWNLMLHHPAVERKKTDIPLDLERQTLTGNKVCTVCLV